MKVKKLNTDRQIGIECSPRLPYIKYDACSLYEWEEILREKRV